MIKKLSFIALTLLFIGLIGSAATFGLMNKKATIIGKERINNENIKSIKSLILGQ
ncbi:hypothetical protein [Bacillus methanolicus]|uniref:Putative membrane protein n=1 Tax=Bacillus methanolicus (strain MGA3 / ATCC 53907) TaxID=796606 RepID=I3E971_BACMM|nr:hypothetical protein [Bacillus methanolicus]AIE60297.1 putative membrane protein [Bacillus methanolicus MGA3]EIJ83042.1 hypothetical protein MGA3_07460 [Bacillus methanolicus MGA3]